MKIFKLVDWMISCCLISGFIISGCWKSETDLVLSYLVVGGWQSVSMIVHAFNKWFTGNATRRAYHWISFISIVTFPLGSVWILFFLSPFMALFYTGLCMVETRKILPRPLSLIR